MLLCGNDTNCSDLRCQMQSMNTRQKVCEFKHAQCQTQEQAEQMH